jgi:hypothetical protein
VALMVCVYAIVTAAQFGWASVHTLGFGAASALLLAAFVALERRLANPILPLTILRLRTLTGSSAVRGLLAIGLYSAFFLGSLYLEHVRGFSAIGTGLGFLPQTLGVALTSVVIAPRVMRVIGPPRTVLAGIAAVLAGLLLLTQAGAHTAYFPGVFGALALLGAGVGLAFLALLTVGMSEVPARDAGVASGIINLSMQLSAALGLATLGTIATDHTNTLIAAGKTTRQALLGGYHLAFTIGAICVAVSALVALATLRTTKPGQAEPLPLRPRVSVASEQEAA